MNITPSRTCTVHSAMVAGRERVPTLGAGAVVVIGGLLGPWAMGEAWRCSTPMSILFRCYLVLLFRRRRGIGFAGTVTPSGWTPPPDFTTRPVLEGTVGMAAGTHWGG